MNIYAGLLFNQGYVADVTTARLLSGAAEPRPAAGDAPRPPGSAPGTREDAARQLQARRGYGGVELRALLRAFR